MKISIQSDYWTKSYGQVCKLLTPRHSLNPQKKEFSVIQEL